nr:MAG TPA: hypothetical protein [Caudoviricetes sp.]
MLTVPFDRFLSKRGKLCERGEIGGSEFIPPLPPTRRRKRRRIRYRLSGVVDDCVDRELESLAPAVWVREVIHRFDSRVGDSWIRLRPAVDHSGDLLSKIRSFSLRLRPRLHRESRRVRESIDLSARALDRHELFRPRIRDLRKRAQRRDSAFQHSPQKSSRIHRSHPPRSGRLQESVFFSVASACLESLRFDDSVRASFSLLEVENESLACCPGDRFACADDCGSRELAQRGIIQLDLHLITHSASPFYEPDRNRAIPRSGHVLIGIWLRVPDHLIHDSADSETRRAQRPCIGLREMKSQSDRISVRTHSRLEVCSPRRSDQDILDDAVFAPLDARYSIRVGRPLDRDEQIHSLALDHRFPPIVSTETKRLV